MEISKSFCFIKNDCLTKKGCLKESWIYSFYCTNLSICLVDVLLFFLFLSCFVLNTHYMWFIEGQDLATEALESSLWGDSTADSEVLVGVSQKLTVTWRHGHCQRRTAPKPPVPKVHVINFLLRLSVGWVKLSRLSVGVFFPCIVRIAFWFMHGNLKKVYKCISEKGSCAFYSYYCLV